MWKGYKGMKRIFEHDHRVFNAWYREPYIADDILDFIDIHLYFRYQVIHIIHEILNTDESLSELQ